MSFGPGSALSDARADSVRVAHSAVVTGTARLGEGSLLAEGAVIRSHGTGVEVGTGSAVLENSVVVGTTGIPTIIGRRTVFGHRCLVIGAAVGDLCEIGNASILMPGAVVGSRVFLGEGTLVPAGTTLPSDVVAVGRPARIVRSASDDDLVRLATLRGGDLSLPAPTATTIQPTQERTAMGQLYEYRGILPVVAASAALFPTTRSRATSSSVNARSSAPASRSSVTLTGRSVSATTSRSSRTPSCTCCRTTILSSKAA